MYGNKGVWSLRSRAFDLKGGRSLVAKKERGYFVHKITSVLDGVSPTKAAASAAAASAT